MSNDTDTVMDLTSLIDAMTSGYRAAGRAWQQAMAMGAEPAYIIRGIRARMDDTHVGDVQLAGINDMLNQVGVAVLHGDEVCEGHERPLTATIKRLLAEAPAPLPNQAPAIECGVMFAGGGVQFMGSLSETPEGGLRMMSPAHHQDQRGVVRMVEQFFDYGDVAVIALKRDVKLESSSGIITNS